MKKKDILSKLNKALEEWEQLLEDHGFDEWDEYDRQVGEINGLKYAIEIIEGKYERIIT